MEERAKDYSSMYGQSYAERHTANARAKAVEHGHKPKDKKRNVTTLATSAGGVGASAAGQDTASTCTSTSVSHESKKKMCMYWENPGHYINTCFKFKKLDLPEKCDVVKKNNL